MRLELKRPFSMTYLLECRDESGSVVYRLKSSGVLHVKLYLLDREDQELIRVEILKRSFSSEVSFFYGDREFMRMKGRRRMAGFSGEVEGPDWRVEAEGNVYRLDIWEGERIIASLRPQGIGFLGVSDLDVMRQEDTLPALAIVSAVLLLRGALGR